MYNFLHGAVINGQMTNSSLQVVLHLIPSHLDLHFFCQNSTILNSEDYIWYGPVTSTPCCQYMWFFSYIIDGSSSNVWPSRILTQPRKCVANQIVICIECVYSNNLGDWFHNPSSAVSCECWMVVQLCIHLNRFHIVEKLYMPPGIMSLWLHF